MRTVALYGAALLALIFGGGCSSDPAPLPRLPLDERLPPGRARAGVVERAEELLAGVTAKGRVGDVKIYNDRIALVIGQKNFARGYQPFGGTILDADRVRAPGEPGQTTFGEIVTAFDLMVIDPDTIEIVQDGRDGGAAIVRVTGASAEVPLFSAILSELITRDGMPLKIQIDYVLEPDRDWIELVFRISNQERAPIDVGLPLTGYMFGDGAAPFTVGAGFSTPEAGVTSPYYGAASPSVTYLYGRRDANLQFILGVSGLLLSSAGESFTLRGRETTEIRHVLVVGDGDLPAAQKAWAQATGQPVWKDLAGRVVDAAGAPVAGARVHVTMPEAVNPNYDYVTMARTDADGRWVAAVPGGEPYELLAVSDALVQSDVVPVATLDAPVELRLAQPGRVSYRVTEGPGGALLPAKLLFEQVEGPRPPPSRYGEQVQPSGSVRAEYGWRGEGSLELPAGTYAVTISRGSEYEIETRTVQVAAGAPATIEAALTRSVDTRGWLSTDTHIHAQLSPDSPDLYPFKVAAMVVEGLEIPVSTEHEWIGDFNPAIREMGLGDWMQGMVGSEVTTFSYGHFNAFPLVANRDKPGNGRIEWIGQKPAGTFANVRAAPGDPFLQVNHPRSASIGGYFSAMGFDPDTFEAARPDVWSTDFDGIEVANGCNVAEIEGETMPDWFAFLNRGVRMVAMGSTDNHVAGRGGLGYPKTYLAMPTDRPSEATVDDFRRAAKEGRAMITCGPFLELTVGGASIGDTAPMTGDRVSASIAVRGPSWVDLDTVELVVNGQVAKTRAVVREAGPLDVRVTLTASVTAGRDAWVIARARGARRHGLWASRAPSYAFTNPVFIDGNGDQRWRP